MDFAIRISAGEDSAVLDMGRQLAAALPSGRQRQQARAQRAPAREQQAPPAEAWPEAETASREPLVPRQRGDASQQPAARPGRSQFAERIGAAKAQREEA